MRGPWLPAWFRSEASPGRWTISGHQKLLQHPQSTARPFRLCAYPKQGPNMFRPPANPPLPSTPGNRNQHQRPASLLPPQSVLIRPPSSSEMPVLPDELVQVREVVGRRALHVPAARVARLRDLDHRAHQPARLARVPQERVLVHSVAAVRRRRRPGPPELLPPVGGAEDGLEGRRAEAAGAGGVGDGLEGCGCGRGVSFFVSFLFPGFFCGQERAYRPWRCRDRSATRSGTAPRRASTARA